MIRIIDTETYKAFRKVILDLEDDVDIDKLTEDEAKKWLFRLYDVSLDVIINSKQMED